MIGSACNRTPDHARHIPSDALCVIGVNSLEINKEIAWSALSGSALIKELSEMEVKTPLQTALIQLEHAGIRFSSTSYMYLKSDPRYGDNIQTTLLVPLKDAAQWENYLTVVFPNASIIDRQSYKEVLIEGEAIAGWNEKLLVVRNVIYHQTPRKVGTVDTAKTSAGLADAFLIERKKGITADNRFRNLESKHHHITVWLNYDAAMAHSFGTDLGKLTAMKIGGALWRGAVLTTGAKFKAGKVETEFNYYAPTELQDIYRNMANAKIDPATLRLLPTHDADFVVGTVLPMAQIKNLLAQTGLDNIAAIFLIGTGLTTDQILDAFTGEFLLTSTGSSDSNQASIDSIPEHNYHLAAKIARKDAFKRILDYTVGNKMILPLNEHPNSYYINTPGLLHNILKVHDDYLVITNSTEELEQLTVTAGNSSEEIKKLMAGRAFGMYLNLEKLGNHPDKKIPVRYITAQSNGFKDGAYRATMDMIFTDDKENSFLQILEVIVQKN